MAFIYALSDPRTPTDIRYIGKTKIRLISRLCQHVADTRRKQRQSPQLSWISSLLSRNSRPIIWPIEECGDNNWQERERYWISFFSPLNRLTNVSAGGNGTHRAKTTSDDVRRKLSISHKGLRWKPDHLRWSAGYKTVVTDAMRKGLSLGVLSTRKRVRCIETGRLFNSMSEASKHLGVAPSKVSASIKRGGRCMGFHFEII